MPLTLETVKLRVVGLIGAEIVDEIITFVVSNNINLWGGDGSRLYCENWMYFVIYRDIEDAPVNTYNAIEHIHTVGHTTIRHNISTLRECLLRWARNVIVLGSQSDWNAVVRDAKFPTKFTAVNLWIDSIDFPIACRKGEVDFKNDYSAKLKKTGCRFMVIQDGNGCVRKLWGPYSPKWYDSHVVQLEAEFFATHMQGAHIIGDSHFSTAGNSLNGVKFYTNIVSTPNKRKRDEDITLEERELRSIQQDWNRSHQRLRARVETPFGLITRMFKSLTIKWRDTKQQMMCLVFYAFAIHNRKRQLNL
jgi:hypothetical protein